MWQCETCDTIGAVLKHLSSIGLQSAEQAHIVYEPPNILGSGCYRVFWRKLR